MPKQTIVLVGDKNKPDEGYLDYMESSWADILDEHPSATLEALADMCDQGAESTNAHDYVGTHRILAALLHHRLGREQATTIMREITEYGGLDGMSGVAGKDSAFKDFGIEDCWHDWKLPA